LLMKVDGYDNYTADLTLIKAELFPLRGYVRTNEISRALSELAERGLISFYEVNGEPFLHLHNNRQKLRWPVSRYPLAPGQSIKGRSERSLTEKSNSSEKEAEVEAEDEVEKEEREKASTGSAAPPPDLKNLKKLVGNPTALKSSLYDIAVTNFKKYFPREERQVEILFRETPPEEMTAAKEKNLRRRYVYEPIMKELDKFMNYYMAELNKWNTLQLNSKWFTWLDRKLEYEKKN
jgi:hypothetical protein